MTFHLVEISRNLGCARETTEAAAALEPYFWEGLPYPVSHPLWRMGFDDEGGSRQLERPDGLWQGWLFQSFENLLRLTGLSLAVDYLLSHQLAPLTEHQQRRLNDALQELRHPSLGHWKGWLDIIVKALEPKGPVPTLLSGFAPVYRNVQQAAGKLIELRNSLGGAHGTRGLSPGHLAAILREGLDLYLPLLDQARWFEGHPLYLLQHPVEELGEVQAWRLDRPILDASPVPETVDSRLRLCAAPRC